MGFFGQLCYAVGEACSRGNDNEAYCAIASTLSPSPKIPVKATSSTLSTTLVLDSQNSQGLVQTESFIQPSIRSPTRLVMEASSVLSAASTRTLPIDLTKPRETNGSSRSGGKLSKGAIGGIGILVILMLALAVSLFIPRRWSGKSKPEILANRAEGGTDKEIAAGVHDNASAGPLRRHELEGGSSVEGRIDMGDAHGL